MDELDTARYISLTTFTRDGDPKSTPVWIVGAGGTLRFVTGAESWKVKRLRNDPRVELRICDVRGRFEPDTTVHHGRAQLLDDETSLHEVQDELLRKYGWQARISRLAGSVKRRFGRGTHEVAVGIDITPTQPSTDHADQ